jgi:DNA-binding IclR family transcriptional regulator
MSLVVSKAFRLIDLVSEGTDTLAELAKAADMSRSTTHRILATLVTHKYLILESKRYKLGYRLLELGEQKKRSLNLLDTLHPVLDQYAEETGDTVHLAVLDRDEIVLIDVVRGKRQLQIASYVGQRTPAAMTAVGKVLIGQLPSGKWNRYLAPITDHYPKTKAQLLEEFRSARRYNFAIDIDECNIGTCGIASSFSIDPLHKAAVSINGATVYFDRERFEALSSVIRQMSKEVEEAISRLAG